MPLRFYPEADNTNPNYNFVQFDQKAYAETAMEWQTNMPYTQKATLVDKIDVQVHIQEGDVGHPSDLTIDILDIHDNLISTLDISHFYGRQVIPGNTFTNPEDGSVTQLASYHYSFTFGEYFTGVSDPLNGLYYLRVSNYSGQSDYGSLYYRSEPILVFPQHPNTVLVQARNNTNRSLQNFIISGWDGATVTGYIPEPQLRVEGHIEAYNPKTFISAYLQQDRLPLMTNSQNYRTFRFNLGSVAAGVPEYMYEKVAEMFICDYFSIDGKAFAYDNDASESGIKQIWKREQNYGGTLGWSEFPIREKYKNQNTSVTVVPYAILPLWRSPRFEAGHDPDVFEIYFLRSFYFIAGGVTVTVPSRSFLGTSPETVFVNYLNTVILPSYGLGGEIILNDSNYFSYKSVAGDVPSLPVSPTLLTKYFSPSYGLKYVSGTPVQVLIKLTTKAGCNLAIDWNEGGALVFDYYEYSSTAPLASITPYHEYIIPVDDYREVWVFHNNKIDTVWLLDSVLSTINGLSDDGTSSNRLPTELTNLTISPAADYLSPAYLDLTGCISLTAVFAVTSNITSFDPIFLSQNQPNLRAINLYQNKLTSAAVDAVFNRFVANTPTPYSGPITPVFNTKFQTPPAPPTAASAAARAFLAGLGWVISTD